MVFFVSTRRTTRRFRSTCGRRKVRISDARMPVSRAMRTIHRSIGFECSSTALSSFFSSSGVSLRFRPGPGAGRRIFRTGFHGSPIRHSLMAIVNRWPSSASSNRTVLFARGIGLPLSFFRSVPARRSSRNFAMISGVRVAKEYLPSAFLRISARRFSASCEEGRLVGVTSFRYRSTAAESVILSAVARLM